MNFQFSGHFGYTKLLRLTAPSILMMIVTSVYSIVDGFFVSNFAGKTQFTAVNFIMPFLLILGSFGFMFGTGGSALISRAMGEGREQKAREIFSLIVYVSAAFGVVIAVAGIALVRPFAAALGAEGQMLDDCVTYARIILAALPAFLLQYEFQCLFATAGKHNLGLFITIAAGLTNVVLDALLVIVVPWGIAGAAVATAVSQCVGGLIPVVYFASKNSSLLRLGRTKFDGRALFKTCTNGSSELMSNISSSIVSMFFNAQLLRYAGEDGVAAYGVLMYVSMIFQSVFIGYSVGSAPVVSFQYGAQNLEELRGLKKRSLRIIAVFAVLMFAAAFVLAEPLSRIFIGYDEALLSLTLRAFSIFSFSFLFSGFSIFGSAFFTALNNGPVSAAISFLRTLVFQIASVLVLPLFFQIDGIWASIVFAEIMSVIMTALFLKLLRKKYGY